MKPKPYRRKKGELEEILSRSVFKLPNHTSQSKYFPGHLGELLYSYKTEIKKSVTLFNSISKYDKTQAILNSLSEYQKDVINVCDEVIEVLKIYLNGSPAGAYHRFCTMIENSLLDDILKYQKVQLLKRDHNFYRLRADKEINQKITITPLDLFHIPFEKRHRVTSQRYSIPGFPCLYTGSSLIVCCKELEITATKDLRKAKIVRLSNNSQINFIDVCPIDVKEKLAERKRNSLLGNGAKVNFEIYNYGILYPLIAACHCKIIYKESAIFKVEYIIPQLILQWFRDFDKHKSISGIRYLCNRIRAQQNDDKYYNYVFPVKEPTNKRGHCKHLKNLFNSTEVVQASKMKFKTPTINGQVSEIQRTINKIKTQKLK